MSSTYFSWSGPTLPEGAVSFFHENGYVVLTDFATKAEIMQLKQRAQEILFAFDPAAEGGASIFSTKKQTNVIRNSYFLESADKVRCFLEENRAPDTATELSVNKIGHALHDKDSVFRHFSRLPKVKACAEALGYEKPLVVQSMYICKQPHIGGEVTSHRDGTFLASVPIPCLGYWWALEDATEENGCLRAVPGSHRDSVSRRMVVNAERTATHFVGVEKKVYSEEDFVPLPMAAGSLILIHGALLHMSRANLSAKSRHAYSIHVVESPPKSTYAADNWLQRTETDPFTGFT